jgi:galactokinase
VTRAFWAPGRVNLIGEHTDYSGGLVLPAALDLGIRIDAAPADRIALTSDTFREPVELPADGGTVRDASGWGRYVAAVAIELAALGRPAVGLDGRVGTTLPIEAGLSSSAALEVVTALALCAVADFELEPLELALAAQRAELEAVGVPCGILDQAASVLGRADHAILIDTGSLEHEAIPLPPGVALLIVDSGVRRTLESSGYAERRRELETGHPGRVRHVETENARVAEAAAVLREPGTPRLARLGELFRESHVSLRDDFEVSTPELDVLVELAYEHGALAARMTGGGFGGSIVALAPAREAAAIGDAVARAYRSRLGRDAAPRVCRASDGARELGRSPLW